MKLPVSFEMEGGMVAALTNAHLHQPGVPLLGGSVHAYHVLLRASPPRPYTADGIHSESACKSERVLASVRA